MTALALRDVACVRGERLLFEGVTASLGPGDAMLVTGSNGAGKSSLIRIAAGLLTPYAGTVERVGATALMAEASALDPERPLADALSFWARIDGDAGAVGRALDAVGLTVCAHLPVRLLSTGQRRRATLARIIASGAAIWLLDEPANGLDAASIAVLEARIAEHRASGGIALVATHQPIALAHAREVRL